MSLEGLKMDKEEIRYIWDGLEQGEEVYPSWRGGWRTLNPWLAMARRLGVTMVKVGSHWRLLRKDLDFDGREGISAGGLEATSYWEFPSTICKTQAHPVTKDAPSPTHTHKCMCAHTHTHTRTHAHTHTYKGSCLCFLISSALKKEKSRKPKETSDVLF